MIISPNSRVIRPKVFDTSSIINADEFFTTIDKHMKDTGIIKSINSTRVSSLLPRRMKDTGIIKSINSMGKVIGTDTLCKLPKILRQLHKPISSNYEKQFGISPSLVKPKIKPDKDQSTKNKSKYFCADCKKYISKDVAMFCFSKKDRFNSKAYCYAYQNKY